MQKMIYDKEALPFILEALDYKTDVEGFVIKNNKRVKTITGKEVLLKDVWGFHKDGLLASISDGIEIMSYHKNLVLKREPTAYVEGVIGKYYMILAHYGEKVLGVSLSSEEAAWFNAYNNQSEEEKGLLLNKIKDL